MVDQFKRNKNKQEEVDRCLKLIQSRNPRDRSYAAKRLGELKTRPDILMSLMDDPNGFVRSASAELWDVLLNCPRLRLFLVYSLPLMTLIIMFVLPQ